MKKVTKKSRLIFRYASYLQPKYILVLLVLNITLSSTNAPRLIIEFPNQVEDKLWALAVSDNLYSYENEKYVDLKYRYKSGFWL